MSFGQVRVDVDSITQTDFGYTGQRNMSSIGLMNYNARFYAQSLGRFIQPDTIVSQPTNPQTWNRYSYVENNPINRVDPTGHDSDLWDCNGDHTCYQQNTSDWSYDPAPTCDPKKTICPQDDDKKKKKNNLANPVVFTNVDTSNLTLRVDYYGRPIRWGGEGAGASMVGDVWGWLNG